LSLNNLNLGRKILPSGPEFFLLSANSGGEENSKERRRNSANRASPVYQKHRPLEN